MTCVHWGLYDVIIIRQRILPLLALCTAIVFRLFKHNYYNSLLQNLIKNHQLKLVGIDVISTYLLIKVSELNFNRYLGANWTEKKCRPGQLRLYDIIIIKSMYRFISNLDALLFIKLINITLIMWPLLLNNEDIGQLPLHNLRISLRYGFCKILIASYNNFNSFLYLVHLKKIFYGF